jgi:polyvinyl alcohol dehydrogenase (cytochrome)
MAYFGDIVGNVYGVDAQTGQLVWRKKADENPDATITGTPTFYGDTLYVPVSALEAVRPADPNFECCHFRGSVAAFDAATGQFKWQTFMGDEPKVVGKNAKGVDEYAPSGAPIWNSPAIDPKRGQIYVGTGENYTSPSNDKSDSIVALDLQTGAFKWVYQARKHDATNLACMSADKTNCPKEDGPDLDFGAGVVLATLSDGRQLVIGGEKSGDVFAVDPDTGKLVWQAKPGRGGMLGGVHFGMAANADTIFVPINDAADGQHRDEPPHPGVYALDLATGKMVWSAPADRSACAAAKHCEVGYAQAITATPELVFAGSGDGWLRGFDARTGQVLWQVDTKLPVKTVNGGQSNGGSFGGGSGPLVYNGMVFASSGYSLAGQTPGNVLLAYEIK